MVHTGELLSVNFLVMDNNGPTCKCLPGESCSKCSHRQPTSAADTSTSAADTSDAADSPSESLNLSLGESSRESMLNNTLVTSLGHVSIARDEDAKGELNEK